MDVGFPNGSTIFNFVLFVHQNCNTLHLIFGLVMGRSFGPVRVGITIDVGPNTKEAPASRSSKFEYMILQIIKRELQHGNGE